MRKYKPERKRTPKNVLPPVVCPVCGKPLYDHSAEQALQCGMKGILKDFEVESP